MKCTPNTRSNQLIANFIDGIADGWHMAVKDSFRNELDIRFTPRVKNKITTYEWTQGPYYCFSEGHLFYDTKFAYDDWGKAVKTIKTACQIVESKPNSTIRITDEVTGKNKFTVLDGYVKFVLYVPNLEHDKLIGFVGYKFTQNEFVAFLKTGQLEQTVKDINQELTIEPKHENLNLFEP